MEAGATFITRKWIATKLKRSERWVTENWRKNPVDCVTEFHGGRPDSLSQESQQIVLASTGLQRRSCRKVAYEILQKRQKLHGKDVVHRFLRKEGLKPFHVISKPLKTNMNTEDRLFLAKFVEKHDEIDFLHFAFSDEFFVYAIRKPNHQNDRIWARDVADVNDDEHFRQVV